MIQRNLDQENDFFLCNNYSTGAPLTKGSISEDDSDSATVSSSILYVPLPNYNTDRWSLIANALLEIQNASDLIPSFLIRQMDTYSDMLFVSMGLTTSPTSLDILLRDNWQGRALKIVQELIPKIARLELSLPNAVQKPIPLLLPSSDSSLTMASNQVSVLLANAFFCAYPESQRSKNDFNHINFNNLFRMNNVEKMKCVLHYFENVITKEGSPIRTMSIIRHKATAPNWAELNLPVCKLIARGDGKIEDDGQSMLMVDFADQYIGGFVLARGCVQEEILFLIYPELIVSCLVCEKMAADESILLVGAQRFSNYTGYSSSFKWMERVVDRTEGKRDSFNRIYSEIVAIDALNFPHLDQRGYEAQFEAVQIDRELKKAFAGFSLITCQSNVEIATGNWGCGVFGGMLQLIAASALDRPLSYFAFGEVKFAEKLNKLVKNLKKKDVKIATIYSWIREYAVERLQSSNYKITLFEFITNRLKKKSFCIF